MLRQGQMLHVMAVNHQVEMFSPARLPENTGFGDGAVPLRAQIQLGFP